MKPLPGVDHFQIHLYISSPGGKIVSDHDPVGAGHEYPGLEILERVFAATADGNIGLRVDESE